MMIAVTGANSSVGQNLLAHIAAHTEHNVIAGARSESAFATLPDSPRITPRVISYDSADTLAAALQGADCIVHLAGILIEGKHTTYAQANVAATRAVVEAAGKVGAKHLVFISVVGADPTSSNSYFRSKGAAEELIKAATCGSSIIRTPILLGPNTAGASALLGSALQARTKVLGGGNYTMRPLDIDDLNQAILRCCSLATGTSGTTASATYELVGPEPISYRDLILRTAELMGNRVVIGSIPIWVAKLGAAVSSRLKGNGITPTVIEVITADEVVAENDAVALNVSLTPLNETLAKIVGKSKKHD